MRHPSITYVYDAFECRDTFYLITERCFGPVSDLFAMKSFDGISWLMPIARCLLQAVHYVHLNGFVHQDIHAGNVFTAFVKDEMPTEAKAIQFKLADLGVAKLLTEVSPLNTRAQWMLPPEVLRPSEFGPVDHRTGGGVVADAVNQDGDGGEDAGRFLVLHEPFDDQGVGGLALGGGLKCV